MAEPARPPMTLGEFLEWDDGTDTRYELIHGVPVAMAPASHVHGVVAGNIGRHLGNALRPPCSAVPQAGVLRGDVQDALLIADIAVSCTPARPGQRWIPDPVLIVEMLSPSTADHDPGTKARLYRDLPSLREILFVSSETPFATLWHRVENAWLVQDLIGDAVLRLESVGVDLPMALVYENVEI